MNFNKVFLLGNLATDVEVRTLPSGQPVASFRVATNRIFKDAQGNLKKEAQFHNVVAFARLADIASKYLSKGNIVFIEGRLNHRSYQDQNATKKYWTEIIAENLQLPPKKWTTETSAEMDQSNETEKEVPIIPEEDPFDEEIDQSTKKSNTINIEEDLPF